MYFMQTDGNRIDAVIYIDDECSIEFVMEGQVTQSAVDGRWLMHYGFIHPPSCYKCFACGLCGDFKRAKTNEEWEHLETCYGSTLPFQWGWDGDNKFAYDEVGDCSLCFECLSVFEWP